MSRLRSLRAQIVLSVALLVAVGVALSGLVIAWRIDQQDRAQVDRQLRARAAKVQEDVGKEGNRKGQLLDGGNKDSSGAEGPSNLLAGTESLTRVLSGSEVIAQRGDGIPPGTAIPTQAGLSTVTIEGQSWRSLVEPTSYAPRARLQVLESLAPVEQRLHDNWRVIAIVAALATLATAFAAWLVAGLVLRPLQRLRQGATRIGPGADAQRLPEVVGPTEIAELSATLNEMIERQRRSMEATRRFTADAGHEIRSPLTGLGMDIETLERNPDIDPNRRAEMLRAMSREHGRIVALLDGLQALARGDSEALPDREPIDVPDLVGQAVEAARRRHQGVSFAVGEIEGATIDGWPDGLRLALDNLLNNAALHGREQGKVEVSAVRDSGTVRIAVRDDGPGILAADRDRLRQRFARGEQPRASGSGLGLALIDQQARLHGGALELNEAVTSGLEAMLSLPLAPDS